MNPTAAVASGAQPGSPGLQPAQRVAAAVAAHPEVARLDGGPFGTVATLLPGAKVVGVRVGLPQEPVEIAVALRYRPDVPPMYRTAEELVGLARVALGPDLAPGQQVTVTVTDVVPDSGPYAAGAADAGPAVRPTVGSAVTPAATPTVHPGVTAPVPSARVNPDRHPDSGTEGGH